MANSSWEEFCGGPIWNSTLLMDNDWPQFTDCFLNTVLVWTPCFFFWMPLPFYLRHLAKKDSVTPVPVTSLNSAKTFISGMLGLLAMITVIQDVSQLTNDVTLPAAIFLGDVLRLLSYTCAAVLTQWERRHDVITSGLQFCFWFLLLLFDVIPLYTLCMTEVYSKDVLSFTLFSVIFLMEGVQVVLFSFSDVPDDTKKNSYQMLGQASCPEVTASFPSQMLFAWMTRYIYRGAKKDLEESDLFHLNPRDTSRVLVPPFEREWEVEKMRVRNKHLQKLAKEGSISMDSTFIDNYPPSSNHRRDSYNGNGLLETTSLVGDGKGTFWLTNGYSSKDITAYGAEDLHSMTVLSELSQPSLMLVLCKLVGPWLLAALAQKVVSDVLILFGPILLGLLIDSVSEDSSGSWQGYVLALLMFLTQMLKSFFLNSSLWAFQTVGMQLKSTLIAAVYKKALTMNSEAKRKATCGEIANIMSVDCQRVQDVFNYFHAWSTPIQVLMVVCVLYNYIGASVFAGMVTLMLLVPFNSYVASLQQSYNRANLKHKDERLKLTNEILNGMKVLKLYAWEPSFEKKISEIRENEIKVLRKIAYLNCLTGVCWTFAPYLVTLATFATFVEVSADNVLDPRRAFVTLALFNNLRVPLNLLSTTISKTAQAIVSLERINKFLCVKDLDLEVVKYDKDAPYAVSVRGGVFRWDMDFQPTLRNINVHIGEGKLIAIVGQVGSGKSSLISAFLGEMEKVNGLVTLKSSVAYVPQQAWIQNATLRDNILFGKPYDEKKYQQVLRVCALERDLEILSAGDMTEIGEKGINLSGGQKQRVSLARAVYSNNDIFFFDDPLSAVDSHVGKHIFNKVMGPKGLLKHKTRILVTHGIHWLPMVDEILVLSDGYISESGSYDQLMSHNGPFAQFLQTYLLQNDESDEDDPEISDMIHKIREDVETATSDAATSGDELSSLLKVRKRKHIRSKSISSSVASTSERQSVDEKSAQTEITGRLTQDETLQTGKVKRDVFLTYFRSAGSLLFSVSMLFFLLSQVLSTGSNVWLSSWTDDPFLATALTSYNKSLSSQYRDRNNYYLTIFGFLGIGQVLALVINNAIYWIRMVIVSKKLHYGLLACVLRAPMSFFDTTPIGRIINRFSRDVETMDNNLPVIIRDLLITCTMAIIILIITSISTPLFIFLAIPLLVIFFCVQSFYIPTSRQLKRLESVTRSPIYTHFSETISGGPSIRAYRASHRFIEQSKLRVDRNQSFYYASMGANRWLGIVLEIIANTVVFGAAIFSVVTPNIGKGTVGLSVSYAMQISRCITWMVRQISDLETNIVSVERVKEYSELEPEVGIVGRTGAGKSSLTLSLFRLIESAGGCIMIDGVNIADIGLHDLRSRITILPQDPVLFSGTLRMNLDPLHEYSDENLWRALERAHLKRFALDLPGNLDYQVGEEGQSLSVGQRQLVCLARTLLRRTKILVLDEATAAVDMETDSLIQDTIRSAFSQSTIITIAHRLNTIMDYDKIMVLDSGVVKEYDTPDVLLTDRSTIFYSMAKDADLV